MTATILVTSLIFAAASQPAAPSQSAPSQPANFPPSASQPAPAAAQPAVPAAKPNTPAAVPAAKPPAASPAAPGAPAPAGDDPRKTMEQMKQRAPSGTPAGPAPSPVPASLPAPAPAGATTPPPAPSSATAEVPQGGRLLREGTFIASRRGRVIKATGGEWQFHFDTGPDNKADAPMGLMPCLNLQAIEKLAERGSEALSFTVSGQVFVYKGRNFLLPTMYTVNRRGDVTPAQ